MDNEFACFALCADLALAAYVTKAEFKLLEKEVAAITKDLEKVKVSYSRRK